MRAKIRELISGDARAARSFQASMLRSFSDVNVVGAASNGTEALDLSGGAPTDIAFLDLQMPELDGMGVVRLLKKNRMPLIAFVTAYDQYAVRAFELNAVDYLLKPVDASRVRETLDRAQERLEQKELHDQTIDHV